jgi:trimethylamine:corrinoid methyltransferase-like protein
MRRGTTPMGAVETAMIDSSYAQVGKYLGVPTHAYMGATDSKRLDMQAGLESAEPAQYLQVEWHKELAPNSAMTLT